MGSEGGAAENLGARYNPLQEFTWGAFLLLMGEKKPFSNATKQKPARPWPHTGSASVGEVQTRLWGGGRGPRLCWEAAGREERGPEGAGNKAPRPAPRPRGGTQLARTEPGGGVGGVQVCGCGCARSEPLPPPPPKPRGWTTVSGPPPPAPLRSGSHPSGDRR